MAERPKVSELYNQIFLQAWSIADRLVGHPFIELEELDSIVPSVDEVSTNETVAEACYIYPEVSANVQGFVRSRASSTGVYFFSDTGAGTVDQSVFIFVRSDGQDHLTYLHANVMPLGSSFIERRAAHLAGETGWQALEQWRRRKEENDDHPYLQAARREIGESLSKLTEATLVSAKKKLYIPRQINETRIIFGGGGHCSNPYAEAVVRAFSGPFFPRGVAPHIIGLPGPRDLELKQSENRWMNRLSVAYGLSFPQAELATFTYPHNVSEVLWKPQRREMNAVTKDEC
jgi:hypothetical protein